MSAELAWAAGGLGLVAAAGFSARYNWWRPRLQGAPILMYHLVTDELNGTGLPKLRVSPRAFARQLDKLRKRGFQAVGLSRALGPQAPAKPVAITFDDGFRNFAEVAWPLLKERGMSATVFLVTSQLGGTNLWDQPKQEPQEPLMNREEILALAREGVEFGGHSHTHCNLTGLDDRGLKREVVGCQKVLTDLLGGPARTFSYPYGLVNPRVAEAASRAGFTLAATTRPGLAGVKTDRHMLPRIMVKRRDGGLDFALKLSRARSTF